MTRNLWKMASKSIVPSIDQCVTRAIEALHRGQVIALPTDTVYGFAGAAQNSESVRQLYKIKERSPYKPLAICVSDINDIEVWAETSHLPSGLLRSLLPGPCTVVLRRKSSLNKSLNPESTTIGVRVPDNSFICEVARKFGEPLALTSANISGSVSSICIEDFRELWGSLGYIYDAGIIPNEKRLASTVVDISKQGLFKIIRTGQSTDEICSILRSYGFSESSDIE